MDSKNTKKFPLSCPSCSTILKVNRLKCPACNTGVEGDYMLPLLVQLNFEEQNYIVQFLKSSGSIKEMSKQMGISYPTMRNQLDDLIEKIEKIENQINESK